jgi:hypothetical protein
VVSDDTPFGLLARGRVWSQAVAVAEVVVGGGSVQAVRVPCRVDRTLIGLGDLMYVVGDGGALRWRLFWVDFVGDVRVVWPQGHEDVAVPGLSGRHGLTMPVSLLWRGR